MQDNEGASDGRSLLSNRTAEILVALLLLGIAIIVMYDSARPGFDFACKRHGIDGTCTFSLESARLGFRWREGEGPAPGYFPFYVALILGISSLVNLAGALRGRGSGETFVSAWPFGRVLAVLLPSIFYVALIGGATLGPVQAPALGIYVASAIFILAFMIVIGRENPIKALAVSVLIPVALFFMFEKWFLVPLPKGPLEAWLGY